MQPFLKFLQQLDERSSDMHRTSVCFVVREPHLRLKEFVSRILFKNFSKKLVSSSLAAEGALNKYDETAQIGLFSSDHKHADHAEVCWLDGFLEPAEQGGFLTQAQKNSEHSKLSQLFQGNAKSYFFEVTAKDFEQAKSVFESLGECVFVKTPEFLVYEEFALCAKMLDFSSSISLQELFSTRLEMSLDHALILFDHVSCVSRRTWDTFKEYSFSLLSDSSQLRDLSESFWTRNSKRFFNEWRRVQHEYPESFWVAYWSSQFFLAFFYIDRAAGVAKITPVGAEHGLSPHFTWKNGWKKYSKEYCERLHSLLFEIDFELKNGSDANAFEYLFNYHFLKNAA